MANLTWNTLEVAREALAQIGTRSTITSLDDGSAEATYINLLYRPILDFLLADGDYDFAMFQQAATPTGTPQLPWTYMYDYPVSAIRIRQLIPEDFDALDPHPVEWNLGPVGAKLAILTRVKISRIWYTVGGINENVWDPLFRQSFVRMLASALAFALENRIEASKVKLDEALGFAGVAKVRDM